MTFQHHIPTKSEQALNHLITLTKHTTYTFTHLPLGKSGSAFKTLRSNTKQAMSAKIEGAISYGGGK